MPDYGEFKPEPYNFCEASADVREALLTALADDDLPNDFFQRPDGPTVLLVINGRAFPFTRIVDRLCETLDARIDEAGRRCAEERMAERTERIQELLRRELDRMFPLTRSGPDHDVVEIERLQRETDALRDEIRSLRTHDRSDLL